MDAYAFRLACELVLLFTRQVSAALIDRIANDFAVSPITKEGEDRPAHIASCETARHQRALHQGVRSCSTCRDEEVRGELGCREPECTEVYRINSSSCGKLLKANTGEVAERLKPAVC